MDHAQGERLSGAREVARIYLRVSTEQQDITRQEGIVHSAKDAGYYGAGTYGEKASGAR